MQAMARLPFIRLPKKKIGLSRTGGFELYDPRRSGSDPWFFDHFVRSNFSDRWLLGSGSGRTTPELPSHEFRIVWNSVVSPFVSSDSCFWGGFEKENSGFAFPSSGGTEVGWRVAFDRWRWFCRTASDLLSTTGCGVQLHKSCEIWGEVWLIYGRGFWGLWKVNFWL